MNIPGFSRPAGLGTSARTITERVLGSTRESTLSTRPVKVCPGNATLVASSVRPGFIAATTDSGTVKSSLMLLVSSSVVMTAPGAMRLPTLTRRRPTRPPKGARITVSLRRERAAATRAWLAACVASICSICWSDSTLVAYSSRLRCSWLALSLSAASATARSARACSPSSSTSSSPRLTCWPSLKRTAVTLFDTLAVMSTDSLARAVPRASISSDRRSSRAGVAITGIAGPPLPAAAPGVPPGLPGPPPAIAAAGGPPPAMAAGARLARSPARCQAKPTTNAPMTAPSRTLRRDSGIGYFRARLRSQGSGIIPDSPAGRQWIAR